MTEADLLSIELTDDERRLLRAGIVEWGGPARCTEEMALAMGFASVEDLFGQTDRLVEALKQRQPLSQRDWIRLLLATEIVFASDVLGSGLDWVHTTGLSDEESIQLLRSVQRKIPLAGAVGIHGWLRPR